MVRQSIHLNDYHAWEAMCWTGGEGKLYAGHLWPQKTDSHSYPEVFFLSAFFSLLGFCFFGGRDCFFLGGGCFLFITTCKFWEVRTHVVLGVICRVPPGT